MVKFFLTFTVFTNGDGYKIIAGLGSYFGFLLHSASDTAFSWQSYDSSFIFGSSDYVLVPLCHLTRRGH